MSCKQCKQLALVAISDAGGTIDSVRQGKHLVVYWQAAGRKFITAFAMSPSDHRAFKNKLAEIRRQVRAATSEAQRVAY